MDYGIILGQYVGLDLVLVGLNYLLWYIMECGRIILVVLTVLVVVLAVLLQGPFRKGTFTRKFPDNLPNKGITRVLLVALDAIAATSELLASLGLGAELPIKRRLTDAFVPPFNYTGLKVSNTAVDGVKVRIYIPEGEAQNRPGIVFYHGGGWSWCSIDTHDIVARHLAREVGAVVISVDYRLAPENPYPVPLQDCETVTKYVLKNSEEFNIDKNRIALAGDSAGGNLAAAISMKLRDTGFKPMPKIQVLVYPLLQAVDLNLPSHVSNDGLLWGSRPLMAKFILLYGGFDPNESNLRAMLKGKHVPVKDRKKYRKILDWSVLPQRYVQGAVIPEYTKQDDKLVQKVSKFISDPYAFPLMAESFENLPETYVNTVEYDTLRDDGIMYVHKLQNAGVKVTYDHTEDGFHSIWNYISPPFQVTSGNKLMNNLVIYLQNNL